MVLYLLLISNVFIRPYTTPSNWTTFLPDTLYSQERPPYILSFYGGIFFLVSWLIELQIVPVSVTWTSYPSVQVCVILDDAIYSLVDINKKGIHTKVPYKAGGINEKTQILVLIIKTEDLEHFEYFQNGKWFKSYYWNTQDDQRKTCKLKRKSLKNALFSRESCWLCMWCLYKPGAISF